MKNPLLKYSEINREETDIQEHNNKDKRSLHEQNTAQNLDQQFSMATTSPRIQPDPVSIDRNIIRKWKRLMNCLVVLVKECSS